MTPARKIKVGAVQERPNVPAIADSWLGHAFKAVHDGTASEVQQMRVMRFIVNKICGADCSSAYHDSQRDTDFALGKLFVAQQIAGLITMHDKKPE